MRRSEMPTTAAAPTVTVRYWAAARAATGTDSEERSGATVGEVVDAAVAAHPDLARVARVASFLLDGRKVGRDVRVSDGGVHDLADRGPLAGLAVGAGRCAGRGPVAHGDRGRTRGRGHVAPSHRWCGRVPS